MKTSATLLTIACGIAVVAAADCAAPGAYDSQGRYSCNPAHEYPDGQMCEIIDGCPLLTDASGNAIVSTPAGSAQPTESHMTTNNGTQPTQTSTPPIVNGAGALQGAMAFVAAAALAAALL